MPDSTELEKEVSQVFHEHMVNTNLEHIITLILAGIIVGLGTSFAIVAFTSRPWLLLPLVILATIWWITSMVLWYQWSEHGQKYARLRIRQGRNLQEAFEGERERWNASSQGRNANYAERVAFTLLMIYVFILLCVGVTIVFVGVAILAFSTSNNYIIITVLGLELIAAFYALGYLVNGLIVGITSVCKLLMRWVLKKPFVRET